jgi:hypothetical protein
MKSDADRLPRIGQTARELGVRPDLDIPVDPKGHVNPLTGGMSITADDPMNLPPHRRPVAYNGIGRDPVFTIEGERLTTFHSLRQDGMYHFLVEPKYPCPFHDFQAAIHLTRPHWLILDS